jgi:Domain of unknown function (DUF4386)
MEREASMAREASMEREALAERRRTAFFAGLFYLGTFVTGFAALFGGTGLLVANLLATFCYVGVTILFYQLFKPVNATVSLVAAIVSAFGCAINFLLPFHVAFPINGLAVFGVYCMLIGYLIVNSRFMPPLLGVALAIGGLSWLTFASPALTSALRPFNFAPGILAEAALMVWLLKAGVRRTA